VRRVARAWTVIRIVADGKTYAVGAAKIVWVDLKSGKSTPLPEHIAEPLRALAKEER
jgi:acyl-CoA thioester hydrolase